MKVALATAALLVSLLSTPAYAQTLQAAAATAGSSRDSLRNGALVGLAVGLAAGAVLVTAKCSTGSERDDCRRIGWAMVVPISGAVGAAGGAIVDSTMRDQRKVSVPVTSHSRVVLSTARGVRRFSVAISF